MSRVADRLFIGVDPGESGATIGIGCDSLGAVGISICRHDEPPGTIGDAIEAWVRAIGPTHCMIENVSAMPKQGVSSTFKFGRNFGLIQGIITALRIPHELVAPGVWQGALRCRSKGDKNVTKRKACELFPHGKWTHRTADAVLIAEYCRRLKMGELK